MSNHLGDANKMVETPRTQAVWELFATDTTLEPDVEFSTLARQLERELNAANERVKRLIRERDEARAERDEAAKVVEKALSELGQVARSRCALIDRIKRLEEALTSIGEYWNRDNNNRAMIDACWYAIDTASEALESKEAKP
jgi:chromosome segregation ATPase